MNRKMIVLLCAAVMYGCTTYPAQQSNATPAAMQILQLPTAIPTMTPTPSPTIDYQLTAALAQQTADEARRVNAQGTAEFEQRIQEQLYLTAQMDREMYAVLSWTATGAVTSIPLTATQQAALNTQIPMQHQVALAQITATWAVPTQMVAIANAESAVKFSKASNIIDMFVRAALGMLCVALAIFLVYYINRRDKDQVEDKDEEPQTQTVIQLDRKEPNGMGSTHNYVIPCSPDQFYELADNLTQGRRTLAINQWEGRGTSFTRDLILQVRAWLRENKFVNQAEDGQLIPTEELLDMLMRWLDYNRLPEGYLFGVGEEPVPA